jgi:four helix bundle protein
MSCELFLQQNIGGCMKDYRELKVWQKAHEYTLAVYMATQDFPREEQYGLTSQLRRATVSVPSNIAEGCGRNSDVELARFLEIAYGSASESDYQLLLAKDLGYLDRELYGRLTGMAEEVRRMLNGFIQKLRAHRS